MWSGHFRQGRNRGPSNAQPSRHLWGAPMTVNLPAGEHQITIEAIDRYGKKYLFGINFISDLIYSTNINNQSTKI